MNIIKYIKNNPLPRWVFGFLFVFLFAGFIVSVSVGNYWIGGFDLVLAGCNFFMWAYYHKIMGV